jgi:N-acetylglucosamine malate deacetylase 2
MEGKMMKEAVTKKMLVILAHPDDESFAVGGTLAKYAQEGVQIVLLCATSGEAGIKGEPPEQAGEIRKQELKQAASHLGIEVHFLGYQDGKLADENPSVLLDHVSCWIGLVQPQVILTFGPDGISGHPDHVTISNIVTQAVDRFYPKVRLLYIAPSEATAYGCGIPFLDKEHSEGIVAIDISDHKFQKLLAIQSHKSQNPSSSVSFEEELENIPCHEYFIDTNTKYNASKPVDWFK